MTKNNYVVGVVDGFHSDADMDYVWEFVTDTVEDYRYINYMNQNDSEFEKNMLHFIYGVGQ